MSVEALALIAAIVFGPTSVVAAWYGCKSFRASQEQLELAREEASRVPQLGITGAALLPLSADADIEEEIAGENGRLSVRAVNLLLERIGRFHEAAVTAPARQIFPLRPHDLRHTFAYRLAAQTGKDAYELERRLGHGSQRYIQRYTNPPEEVETGYVEKF